MHIPTCPLKCVISCHVDNAHLKDPICLFFSLKLISIIPNSVHHHSTMKRPFRLENWDLSEILPSLPCPMFNESSKVHIFCPKYFSKCFSPFVSSILSPLFFSILSPCFSSYSFPMPCYHHTTINIPTEFLRTNLSRAPYYLLSRPPKCQV